MELQQNSLLFVRNGWLYTYTGKVRFPGENGYSWSFTPGDDSSKVYVLGFYSDDIINPSNGNARWYAFPLRCLAS